MFKLQRSIFKSLSTMPITALGERSGPMGCGEEFAESRTVALGGATAVRASLELGVGELLIGGGGRDLLDADFIYNVPAWRPELDYAVEGERGRLTLWQPSSERPRGVLEGRNRWGLRFAERVPLDLGLKLGVIEGKLCLGKLSLERLSLEVGTGNFTLDLTETRARSLHVPIRAGVLNLKLIVPRDTGVQVEVRSPVLTMHAKEWQRARHIWVNEAYAGTADTMRVIIESGVASITLAQQAPVARPQPVAPLLH